MFFAGYALGYAVALHCIVLRRVVLCRVTLCNSAARQHYTNSCNKDGPGTFVTGESWGLCTIWEHYMRGLTEGPSQ